MFRYFPENYMWSLAVLRALASGGHFGEIDWACAALQVAAAVPPNGDGEAWHTAWLKLSDQVHAFAMESLAKRHNVSARDAFIRAAVYYQWAEAFLEPDDRRAQPTFAKHLDCFAAAADLFEPKVEILSVPFEKTSLTAYFVPARGNAAKPAPAVILSDGLDGTKEEMFYVARSLSERGIACLGFDGPGQGATLRLRGLVARHDSEAAVSACYEYLAARPGIDRQRIGLMAASMGGYYAPRAVAFEKRIKACVAWAAIYDYHACWARRVGWRPGHPIAALDTQAALGTTAKHFLRIMGVADWPAAFKKLEKFRLEGIASQIECPILIVHGANDRQTPLGEARQLFDEIRSAKKELRVYTDAEGGAAHVQLDRPEPALSRICDWFADHL